MVWFGNLVAMLWIGLAGDDCGEDTDSFPWSWWLWWAGQVVYPHPHHHPPPTLFQSQSGSPSTAQTLKKPGGFIHHMRGQELICNKQTFIPQVDWIIVPVMTDWWSAAHGSIFFFDLHVNRKLLQIYLWLDCNLQKTCVAFRRGHYGTEKVKTTIFKRKCQKCICPKQILFVISSIIVE